MPEKAAQDEPEAAAEARQRQDPQGRSEGKRRER